MGEYWFTLCRVKQKSILSLC